MNPTMKKSLIASSVVLALGGATAAHASLVPNVMGNYTFSTDSANFTMLAGNGGVTCCGANNVAMAWDGNAYSASSDYTGPGSASNVTASSSSAFFGHNWTAHDIQVFIPGSYSFDTTLQSVAHPNGGNGESGILNVTVPANYMGMHMLFDWNGSNNIDVFVVATQGSAFGSGLLYSTQTNTKGQFKCDSNFTGTIVKNCLDDSNPGPAGAPTKGQIWALASTDGNGDGLMGIPMMPGGPFPGFNANFSANLTPTPKVVPVPAAVWLFGSGLLGLVGIARRKKS